MTLFDQGGPLMWPLLALSLAALAVILDRGIVLSTLGFPIRGMVDKLGEAVRRGDADVLQSVCATLPAAVRPFGDVLLDSAYAGEKARALHLLGEGIVRDLSRHVGVLGLVVRLAPLVGLLGTVYGMIVTFSGVAAAGGAVDMAGLAGGIWQALLTTAAGLSIAIPALAAQLWCNSRIDRVSDAMNALVDAAFALEQSHVRVA